ncbi:methyltransferase domain-containing protein [Hellea sp.]|jgi:ubiquinone/menaquinone biosynthesis C-methylase UbiE|nr:methyltransferase domain-containing protein [Hellea sp.]
MGLYKEIMLPWCLDKACGTKAITKQREKIIPLASGIVLEIGIGSGLNIPHYDVNKVIKVLGLEPDENMWTKSIKRRKNYNFSIERIGLSGEEIPLKNNSVDNIVVTYSLCTIPNPIKALIEMKRVLRPGGKIFFSEHGKAPDIRVQKLQNFIDPFWSKIAGGCHSGRDIPFLFKQAGLKFEFIKEMYIPGPRVLSYNYWGAAVA